MPPKRRVCVDCGIASRPARFPGPRCATDNRARKQQARDAAFARRLLATYNLTVEQYEAIYAHQGGKCALCQRATGKVRRLACDHDHACCDGPTSCGNCVRGLLCGTCNKTLGHYRDDPAAFQRAIDYLLNPPARAALRKDS